MLDDSDYSGAYHDKQNMAQRVILSGIDDGDTYQKANISGVPGVQFSEVHRVQPFGLSANPPAGSHGVLVNMTGMGPLLFGTEHKDFRPTGLPSGGTRLYDNNGSYVDLDAAGNIVAVCSTQATIRAPNIRLEGAVHITGNVTTDGSITSAGAHTASVHN